MPPKRPAIPEPLKREVLIEAGHRCAIPTCKSIPVQIAHIIPWEKVKKHEFENLIALCPNCHSLYDVQKSIDRKSMQQYKLNLALVNSRYGDLERRVLSFFAYDPPPDRIYLHKSLEILVMYLIQDEIIEKDWELSGLGDTNQYILTDKGNLFIEKYSKAVPID